MSTDQGSENMVGSVCGLLFGIFDRRCDLPIRYMGPWRGLNQAIRFSDVQLPVLPAPMIVPVQSFRVK